MVVPEGPVLMTGSGTTVIVAIPEIRSEHTGADTVTTHLKKVVAVRISVTYEADVAPDPPDTFE